MKKTMLFITGAAVSIAALILLKKYGAFKFLELDFIDPLPDDHADYDED